MTLSRFFRVGSAAVVLVLSACASDPASAPQATTASSVPPPTTQSVPAGGTYEGIRTPAVETPDCGSVEPIGFDVAGSVIRLRTHRERRELSGSVDGNGRFTMTNQKQTRLIAGQVVGDQLTATETTVPHRRRHEHISEVAGGICTARIQAKRVPSGG